MSKRLALLFCSLVLVAESSVSKADPNSVRELLKRTSDRYRSLTMYQIIAKTNTFVMGQPGQSGSRETKTSLAVGGKGVFRVGQDVDGAPELRLSDGANTWKVLPKQKLWAKQSTAQAIGSDDEDVDSPGENMGQDLFTQTQLAFVRRYMGLERYAGTAQIEGETKLKLNGEKVDCVVVHLPVQDADKSSVSRP